VVEVLNYDKPAIMYRRRGYIACRGIDGEARTSVACGMKTDERLFWAAPQFALLGEPDVRKYGFNGANIGDSDDLESVRKREIAVLYGSC
jgi:hypothetical protein